MITLIIPIHMLFIPEYIFIFIFKRDRHRIHCCDIGNVDLSDHAPLLLSLQISNNPRNTLWRINNSSILNNLQFKTQMKEDIKMFLDENDNREVGTQIVWDALKAVFRGEIIYFCACKKRGK